MNSSHSELTDKLFVRIYDDNKSSYKQVSIQKIFESAGYVCLSDIQHVFHFNYKNNFLEIVTMPSLDPDFRCVGVHNTWYANRINLDKKLDLSEPSTFDFLIKNGLEVNKALVYACLTNRICVVRYLTELGADIGFDDDRPITAAISAGHFEIVKYLFDAGSYQGRSNDATIENCVYWGRIEIFDYVFSRSQDTNIDKILDMACNSNKPEIIKYIINHDYQTCHADSFEYMCYTGDIDIVKKFIKNGVDVRKHTEAFARAYAHPDIVELLIEAGADVQANNNRALEQACAYGYMPTVKMLIHHGANFRFNNDSALRQAARYGKFDVVKYLVDLGCDIRIDNNFALSQAARYGNLEIVTIFANLGIDVTCFNFTKDQYVLKIACDYGNFNIVKYIVEHITVTSYDYYCAIKSAAKHHHTEIVMYLIDKVSDSQTVADIVVYLAGLGNLNIIQYIFENKKDIWDLDEALSRAIYNGNTHIIDYLIKKEHVLNWILILF